MGVAGIAGGMAERAIDGDSGTHAADPVLVVSDGLLGAAGGAASQYGRSVAGQALEKTGTYAQKISRGQSLAQAGKGTGDLAKIRKGTSIIQSAKKDALKNAGNPGSGAITAHQEAASEIASQARQEENNRKKNGPQACAGNLGCQN